MNSESEFDPPDKHVVPAETSAKQEGNKPGLIVKGVSIRP